MSFDKLLGSVDDPMLVADLKAVLERFSIIEIERIPEVRNLIGQLMALNEERMRVASSMNLMPSDKLVSIVRRVVDDAFEVAFGKAIDRLFRAVNETVRKAMDARFDTLASAINDLKRSVLMAHINPYGWMEAEIVSSTETYLVAQPGRCATLSAIYHHLAVDARAVLPGASIVDRQTNLVQILKRADYVEAIEGFLFRLSESYVGGDGIDRLK